MLSALGHGGLIHVVILRSASARRDLKEARIRTWFPFVFKRATACMGGFLFLFYIGTATDKLQHSTSDKRELLQTDRSANLRCATFGGSLT
jgi:hypothetical protein